MGVSHHRYYDPTTGKYLTPDPIGLAGGINLFAYAANNPINYADLEGLCRNSDESFFACLDREAKEAFGTLLDVTDTLGYYGLGSAVIGVGSMALASAGEHLAREGIKNARMAGAWAKGNILAKLAASSRGERIIGRLVVLRTSLGVASKASGVVGASATAASIGFRALFIPSCSERCPGCSE